MWFNGRKIEIVKCAECRHPIDRSDAQKIRVSTCGITMKEEYGDCFEKTGELYCGGHYEGNIFFCEMHKKKYDLIMHHRDNYHVTPTKTSYYKNVPADLKEVDENGEDFKKMESAIQETKRCQKGDCQSPAYCAYSFCLKHLSPKQKRLIKRSKQ